MYFPRYLLSKLATKPSNILTALFYMYHSWFQAISGKDMIPHDIKLQKEEDIDFQKHDVWTDTDDVIVGKTLICEWRQKVTNHEF